MLPRNLPESLSGIETVKYSVAPDSIVFGPEIYPNPFQGLKQDYLGAGQFPWLPPEIYPNPFQGLKRLSGRCPPPLLRPEIYPNPFQGLKRLMPLRNGIKMVDPKFTRIPFRD